MLIKVGQKFETWMRKVLPDPLVIAIILTLIVGLLAVIFTPTTPIQVVENWSKGFWELIAFTMQVAFGLIAGAVLAKSPIVNRGMVKLCSLPKKNSSAVLLLSFTTLVLWWVNWGIGLIAGAFLAKEMAVQLSKKNVPYHLPLLAAGGYSGIMTYEMGLTGAIPLQIAAAGHRFEEYMGVIPLSQTLFGSFNLICTAGVLILIPLSLLLMSPQDPSKMTMLDPAIVAAENARKDARKQMRKKGSFAEKVENMRFWSIFVGIMGIAYAINHFAKNGFNIDLNVFNLIILCLGMLAWLYPLDYAESFKEQTVQSWGVLLQFPFYAGIMGMMVVQNEAGVSLAGVISQFFVNISNNVTFPMLSFLAAGIVNFFVPSGGGQWAVQGPIMMPAGAELGIGAGRTAMAIAWGDQWTNMIQPFWALPALGIAKLSARDIMGYLVVVLLFVGLVACLGFLAWGLLF